MADLAGYLFTREHEWLKIEGGRAKVGISDYAQHKLGDVTYVELPPIGKTFKQKDVLTGIESVKAASDIYAPAGGKVTGVNKNLELSPELVNGSPYENGWIAEIELSDPSETGSLMTEAAYTEYVKGLE